MGTEKQSQANRANARKSTGPRSLVGKSASSKNAVKHGILSQAILLPGEDPDEFEGLTSSLRLNLQISGELEEELLRIMVVSLWRLRRIDMIEASIFTRNYFLEKATRAEDRAQSFIEVVQNPTLQRLRAERQDRKIISNEAEHQKAKQEAAKATDQARTQAKLVGDAFLRDASEHDALGKLSRYSTSIQRNLYRALHELERLQARREKNPVARPITVDLNGSKIENGNHQEFPQ